MHIISTTPRTPLLCTTPITTPSTTPSTPPSTTPSTTSNTNHRPTPYTTPSNTPSITSGTTQSTTPCTNTQNPRCYASISGAIFFMKKYFFLVKKFDLAYFAKKTLDWVRPPFCDPFWK